MKTLIKLSMILFTIIIVSCSKDIENNDSVAVSTTKKPKKIEKTITGQPSYTLRYEYDGQKLIKIEKVGTQDYTTITYNANNKLQQITNFYGSESEPTVATYSSSGNLSQLLTTTNTSGGTKLIKFYYDTSNKVNKTEQIDDSILNLTILYEYDINGNVIKQVINNIDLNIVNLIINNTYDNKNNPFKNVTTQIDDFNIVNPWFGNLNNNKTNFENIFPITYEYDSDNFPIKRIYKSPNGVIEQIDLIEY